MKKEVLLTIILGVLFIANVLCMIVAPFSWAGSVWHFSELAEFKEKGKVTIGKIVGKTEGELSSKKRSYYLDVSFYDSESSYHLIEDHYVSRIIYNMVDYSDEVEIYYLFKDNGDPDLVLSMSYDVENLSMNDHPLVGKWVTIISYSLFIAFLIWLIILKRKKKSKRYVRDPDTY